MHQYLLSFIFHLLIGNRLPAPQLLIDNPRDLIYLEGFFRFLDGAHSKTDNYRVRDGSSR
jgi:hypothetical protein